MARNNYKQEKRKKDLARQKAQEEKRLRKLAKHKSQQPENPDPDQVSEPAKTDPPTGPEA